MAISIYLVGGSLKVGGAERVISILANDLIFRGYNITILLWKTAELFYSLDQRIKVVDIQQQCKSENLFANMIYFRYYIKKFKPDLVLSFMTPINIVTIICLLGIHVKMIVAERSDPRYAPTSKFRRLLRNLLYHSVDGILTQTDKAKEYFSKSLQKKINIIYNPVFVPESKIGSALKCTKKKIIVSVGRLVKVKNHEMLLKAFSLFYNNHNGYSLVIYGEGPCRERLEHMIEELNMKDHVFLPGIRENILEVIENAEMFVLVSNYEGMPNSLFEAMCIGLPCISTKVSGAVDLIIHGANGLLVEAGDEKQLCMAIEQLAQNSKFRKFLAANATAICKKLNIGVITKEWEHYLNNFLK